MSDQPSTGATTPPSTATDAILRRSDGVPPELLSDTVRGVNWNQVHQSQQPLSVNDLVNAMAQTGFQATSVAEAVRIINDMVALSIFFLLFTVYSNLSVHHRGRLVLH